MLSSEEISRITKTLINNGTIKTDLLYVKDTETSEILEACGVTIDNGRLVIVPEYKI